MFRRIWEKYLPVLRILMKKAENEAQTLELNKLDFDVPGLSKAKTKFKLELQSGNVANVIHDSPVAVELAHLLMDDDQTSEILKDRHYVITVNSGLLMKIKITDE